MSRPLKRVGVLVIAAVVAVAFAAPARADLVVGVSDDSGKYAEDGGAEFFSAVKEAGLSVNRVTVRWDPDQPLHIVEKEFLDRSLPVAAREGVEVVFAVYPATAKAFAVGTRSRIRLFADFLEVLARTYPRVRTYIVGNEPNQPRFFQPQFVRTRRGGYRPVAGATYARVLAAAYDSLKGVDSSISVVGLGLSARGNDNPTAPNNVSRSPVRFLRDLAAEYRRSGRTRPLMDKLAFHPYPADNAAPLLKGHLWPNAGVADLDRIRQAVWDGFRGTAQPTFPERGRTGRAYSLRFVLGEYGRQVEILPALEAKYFGRENVRTISEERQAQLYRELIEHVACDPSVERLLIFRLIDNADLDRFQSGLLRVDNSRRPSYEAVRQALAAGASCGGTRRSWRHSERVAGLEVRFSGSVAKIKVAEEALVTVATFPARTQRQAIVRSLTGNRPQASGRAFVLRPHRRMSLALRNYLPATGAYVTAALVRASMNPKRYQLAVSRPFRPLVTPRRHRPTNETAPPRRAFTRTRSGGPGRD